MYAILSQIWNNGARTNYMNYYAMTKRLQIPWIGEYYADALTLEARIKNRTEVQEAASLLCAKLMERKSKREEMIQYLADKRGISFDEMKRQLLTGEYKPLEPEEIVELEEVEEGE